MRSVLYGASLDSFSSSLIVGDSRSFYQATNYGELEKPMFTWNSDTDGSLRNFLSGGIIRFNWNWLECLFEVSKQRDALGATLFFLHNSTEIIDIATLIPSSVQETRIGL